MSALRSLTLAMELASRQRDAAQAGLLAAQKNVAFAQGQLTQLQGYAGETDQRWASGGPGAIGGELVQHHYLFMDRLQHAIVLQEDAVGVAQQQQARAQQQLVLAEQRLAALKQLLAVRQQALHQVQERKAQRQTDEFAMAQYARTLARRAEGDSV